MSPEDDDFEEAPLELIDVHCHLAWEECVPREFVDGAVENVYCCLAAHHPEVSREAVAASGREGLQDPHGDELIRFMDESGVGLGWLLVPDMTYALKSFRLSIEELLLHHAAVAKRHPGRFMLFAGVDPRWGSDGLALFERAVNDWGYEGLKLYPPCGFSPSDRTLYPYYEICSARGLPVLVHVGPTSPCLGFNTAHPTALDACSLDFPDVAFVLGHGGSVYVEESVMMCAFRPNVFLEPSGFQRLGGLSKWTAHLAALFARQINHKILFGTDWPVFQSSVAELTRALRRGEGAFGEVLERDRRLIASGNAQRIASKRKRPSASSSDSRLRAQAG